MRPNNNPEFENKKIEFIRKYPELVNRLFDSTYDLSKRKAIASLIKKEVGYDKKRSFQGVWSSMNGALKRFNNGNN